MRRYELIAGASKKFWEIELEGRSFTTRYGRIGTDGQTSTKEWKSEAEAKKQHDKLVAEKVKGGYVLVVGGASGGSGGASPAKPAVKTAASPDLEQALFDAPDAPDAYLAYGDWCRSQGDPRGEFITVQVALADKPHDAALKRQEEKLLNEHEEAWLGDLAELKDEGDISYTWRYGFLHTISLGSDGDGGSERDGAATYLAFAKLPAAKCVRELAIGIFADDGELEYGRMVEAMVEGGIPKALRKLTFDVHDFQISWSDLGDISALYPQLGKLEALFLRVGRFELGKIVLPSLRRFEAVTGGLTKENMASIAATKWPELRSLVLYFGAEEYGGDCDVDDLRAVLAGRGLGKLEHLGLCNAEFADEIAAALPAAKILKQLTSLDLSKGTLGDEGAAHLVKNAAAFKHLQRIDLSQNYISGPMVEELNAAFGDAVEVEDQGDASDPDDRYVQISE